ncbi:MAG: alpha/beta fold hydrolase [Planctomycetota bacterium]|nr:alpha/beta fold hydrolase [Planctomycetota bacterium]
MERVSGLTTIIRHWIWLTPWLVVHLVGCNSLPDLTEGKQMKLAEQQNVVVVHGLFRTQRAMRPLRTPLTEAGFHVIEYRYPSTQKSVEELGRNLRQFLVDQIARDPQVPLHVVGHSLGAVISVKATTPTIPGIGRVVQISPPNLGSPWASKLEGVLGPWIATIEDLSSREGGPLPRGTMPGSTTGVIAANSDTLVPQELTQLDGAADQIHLPGSHTFVFWRTRTQQEIIHFLIHGRFSDDAPRS